MHKTRPMIAVVDDDPRLLDSLEELLESAGYTARCFGWPAACSITDYRIWTCS